MTTVLLVLVAVLALAVIGLGTALAVVWERRHADGYRAGWEAARDVTRKVLNLRATVYRATASNLVTSAPDRLRLNGLAEDLDVARDALDKVMTSGPPDAVVRLTAHLPD